eukprot:TRINITY_DN10049_c0_g1_i2.p2 TRINITY_DN10049_c0_g1~~TRINITY_DN10049_c0_g1_i2.p2  ORF type:complete len:134 (-),score=29.70 TRINITY_DN10049_c0_g1_i2:100-501(-)
MEGKEYEPRCFTSQQKRLCWERAARIWGRDPERWRLDAIGNPVLNALRGCFGAYCHEYDHVVPFSKGGHTTVGNCQILQTAVNRYKGNQSKSYNELRGTSMEFPLTDKEMDFLEYAVYGDVKRVDMKFPNKLV